MTTLDIIQDRVYPQWAKMYEGWNIAPLEVFALILLYALYSIFNLHI